MEPDLRTRDLPRSVHVSPYSGRDLCKVTPVILDGVVSPDLRVAQRAEDARRMQADLERRQSALTHLCA